MPASPALEAIFTPPKSVPTSNMSASPALKTDLPIRSKPTDAPTDAETTSTENSPDSSSHPASDRFTAEQRTLREEIVILGKEACRLSGMIQDQGKLLAAFGIVTKDDSVEAENEKLKKENDDLKKENAKLQQKIQGYLAALTMLTKDDSLDAETKALTEILGDGRRGNPGLAMEWDNFTANPVERTREDAGRLLAETYAWHCGYRPENYDVPPSNPIAASGVNISSGEPILARTPEHPNPRPLSTILANESLNCIHIGPTIATLETQTATRTWIQEPPPSSEIHTEPSTTSPHAFSTEGTPTAELDAAPFSSDTLSNVQSTLAAIEVPAMTTNFAEVGVESFEEWEAFGADLEASHAPPPPTPSSPSSLASAESTEEMENVGKDADFNQQEMITHERIPAEQQERAELKSLVCEKSCLCSACWVILVGKLVIPFIAMGCVYGTVRIASAVPESRLFASAAAFAVGLFVVLLVLVGISVLPKIMHVLMLAI